MTAKSENMRNINMAREVYVFYQVPTVIKPPPPV